MALERLGRANLSPKMSAPAILLSEDGKKSEKVKVSAAQCLVRQLMAIEITAKRLYQRVKVSAQPKPLQPKPRKTAVYQHHIEPRIHRVNWREMEELERWRNFAL